LSSNTHWLTFSPRLPFCCAPWPRLTLAPQASAARPSPLALEDEGRASRSLLAVTYTASAQGLDCTGTDLQTCYGYGQYRIAGQGTYAFCAQSCDACSGCTGFGISNNGCWLKRTSGIHALTNSQCWLAPSAMAALPSPPPPPSPSSPPPPTIYTTSHVLDAAASSSFTGKVLGGPTMHVLNNGATTTSTETTASGKHNVWETTSTSDVTQKGLGNGQTLSKMSSESTTTTDHQQTFKKVNVHTSTSDLYVQPADVPTAPALCGGTAFAVTNTIKNLCLHVKGGVNSAGFAVANVKSPVITAACVQGSPNQRFTWLPSPQGGLLVHDATQQALSLASGTVTNGSPVILAPQSDAPTQEWIWNNPTIGGTLSAVADPAFQITDSMVNANVAVGLPAHMWHLSQSLPSGAPKAAWMATCGNDV